MANRNKQKGDRAERAVRDWAVTKWPASFKTRAGFDDDLGDIICLTRAGALVLQVKDVAKPAWGQWFTQLASQVRTCREKFRGNKRVIGGVIVHKSRGVADPSKWKAICTLEHLSIMIEEAYNAGQNDTRKEMENK